MNFREELDRIRLGEKQTNSEKLEILFELVVAELTKKEKSKLKSITQLKFEIDDKNHVNVFLRYDEIEEEQRFDWLCGHISMSKEGVNSFFSRLADELKKQKFIFVKESSNTIIVEF